MRIKSPMRGIEFSHLVDQVFVFTFPSEDEVFADGARWSRYFYRRRILNSISSDVGVVRKAFFFDGTDICLSWHLTGRVAFVCRVMLAGFHLAGCINAGVQNWFKGGIRISCGFLTRQKKYSNFFFTGVVSFILSSLRIQSCIRTLTSCSSFTFGSFVVDSFSISFSLTRVDGWVVF